MWYIESEYLIYYIDHNNNILPGKSIDKYNNFSTHYAACIAGNSIFEAKVLAHLVAEIRPDLTYQDEDLEGGVGYIYYDFKEEKHKIQKLPEGIQTFGIVFMPCKVLEELVDRLNNGFDLDVILLDNWHTVTEE